MSEIKTDVKSDESRFNGVFITQLITLFEFTFLGIQNLLEIENKETSVSSDIHQETKPTSDSFKRCTLMNDTFLKGKRLQYQTSEFGEKMLFDFQDIYEVLLKTNPLFRATLSQNEDMFYQLYQITKTQTKVEVLPDNKLEIKKKHEGGTISKLKLSRFVSCLLFFMITLLFLPHGNPHDTQNSIYDIINNVDKVKNNKEDVFYKQSLHEFEYFKFDGKTF